MRSGVEIHFASGLYGPSYYGHGEVDAFYLWTGDYPVSAQPLPTVSVSQDSIHQAKRIGATTKITLQGQITGDSTGDFKQLINYQRALRDRFSRSFAPFHIKEEGEIIFSRENAWVDSITFSESNYNRLIDYTININAHDFNNWSGYPGDDQTLGHVVDLEDSWSFSDSEDGTASVTHNISARGLHEHYSNRGGLNNPISNAENWIKTRTGSANMPQPFLVGDGKTAYPILLSNSHNVDRAEGTVSATETYGYNTGAIQLEPIMSHNISIQSGVESDFITVSYDATLKGGQSIRLDDIYSSQSHMRYIEQADVFIRGETQINDLNSTPISFNYAENSGENSISYSATYDNNNLYREQIEKMSSSWPHPIVTTMDGVSANVSIGITPSRDIYWDYTVSFDTDEIRNVTTVSLDGPLKTRGPLKYSQSMAAGFIKLIEEKGFAYDIATGCYHNLLSTRNGQTESLDPTINVGAPLNGSTAGDKSHNYCIEFNHFRAGLHRVPTSFSVNKNHFTKEYSISCSFTDAKVNNVQLGVGTARSYSYSIDVTPSLVQFNPKPSCNQNGHYVIWDTSAGKNEQITFNIEYQGAGSDFASQGKVELDRAVDYMYLNVNDKFSNPNTSTSYVVSETQNTNLPLKSVSYNQSKSQLPYNQGLGGNTQFMFGKYHDVNGITFNVSPYQ